MYQKKNYFIKLYNECFQAQTINIFSYCRDRNNSTISGSQQDYLVGKSGSPQIYLVVIWPRFKQNNMTNTKFDKYSHFWGGIFGLLLSSFLVV